MRPLPTPDRRCVRRASRKGRPASATCMLTVSNTVQDVQRYVHVHPHFEKFAGAGDQSDAPKGARGKTHSVSGKARIGMCKRRGHVDGVASTSRAAPLHILVGTCGGEESRYCAITDAPRLLPDL